MSPGLTSDPHHFAAAWARLPAIGRPTLRAALMVDARGFDVAQESAADNAYMDLGLRVDRARAQRQLDAVAATLRSLDVPVLMLPGRDDQPDGVFPNNVVATAPGRFVIGSMRHAVRRREAARQDIRELFTGSFGYRLHDLSQGPGVAELTGVLAIDRRRGAAVCGMGPRVDPVGAEAMHEALDLALTLTAEMVPGEYHLNLILAVLAGDAAVVWDEGFRDPEVPRALASMWPGRLLHLTEAEKDAFAGNCLAVTPSDVMLSTRAWEGLCPASRSWFPRHGLHVHPVDVDELEKGGGSLRCLVAEVF